MAHPHPNPLGNKEGLLGRVAPYRERLFERFFHRGRIEAHSTEDLGTTFRVELPLRGEAGSPNAGDRGEIAA